MFKKSFKSVRKSVRKGARCRFMSSPRLLTKSNICSIVVMLSAESENERKKRYDAQNVEKGQTVLGLLHRSGNGSKKVQPYLPLLYAQLHAKFSGRTDLLPGLSGEAQQGRTDKLGNRKNKKGAKTGKSTHKWFLTGKLTKEAYRTQYRAKNSRKTHQNATKKRGFIPDFRVIRFQRVYETVIIA